MVLIKKIKRKVCLETLIKMEGDNKENKKDDGKKKMSKEDRIAARQAPKVYINRLFDFLNKTYIYLYSIWNKRMKELKV